MKRRLIYYTARNEMRDEDIRRVLLNFIDCMPKAYRKRTRNARVVMDIIQRGTGQAGMTSCCEVCRRIGCDPDAYSFPNWEPEELGARFEEVVVEE